MLEHFPRPYPCSRASPPEGLWVAQGPCQAVQAAGRCPFRRPDGTLVLGDPVFYRQEDLPLDCWLWASLLPALELPHSPGEDLGPLECLDNAARLEALAEVQTQPIRREWYLFAARWYRLVASLGCRAGTW